MNFSGKRAGIYGYGSSKVGKLDLTGSQYRVCPFSYAHTDIKPALADQHPYFPKGNRRNHDIFSSGMALDDLQCPFPKRTFALSKPDQRVRIEQDHAPVPGSSSS